MKVTQPTLFDSAGAPRKLPSMVAISRRVCKMMGVNYKKYYKIIDFKASMALGCVVIDTDVFISMLEEDGYDDESGKSINEFLLERYGAEKGKQIARLVCLDEIIEL